MEGLKNLNLAIITFFLVLTNITFGMLRNIPIYRRPVQAGVAPQQGNQYQFDMSKSQVTAEQKDQISSELLDQNEADQQRPWIDIKTPQEAKDLSSRSSGMFRKTPNLYQSRQDALILKPEEKSQKGEREEKSKGSKYKKAGIFVAGVGAGLAGVGLYEVVDDLLKYAVKTGNVILVKLLLQKVQDTSWVLVEAVEQNNIEIIKLLLPKAEYYLLALVKAVRQNNIEIIKLLLTKEQDTSLALVEAVKQNNMEIINLLLPKADYYSSALVEAVKQNNIEIIKLLLPFGIDDLNLVTDTLKQIKYSYPEKYMEFVNSHPIYKEAMILGSFQDRDWVIELLKNNYKNDEAKTQTEQLFLKYYAKAPRELFAFAHNATNDKNIAYLVGHYPLLSNVVHRVVGIEKDDEKNGYVTFVHGRNWEWNYVNDVWNIISAVRHNKNELPTTISMRQRDIDCDISRLQRARKNLVEKGVEGDHLVSSTTDLEKDANEAERSEVTFMNYTGLSHLESWPECSIRYCLQNHSANGGASGKEFAQRLIEKYELIQYQDDFDQLYEKHKNANNYGELLTISIAKNNVNDIAYPARLGGYLLPQKGTALQAIQECQKNIEDNKNSYLQGTNGQAPIFCAAALNIPGEGEDVCKIRSVHLADPEKYQEYKNKRQALFEKIKKDYLEKETLESIHNLKNQKNTLEKAIKKYEFIKKIEAQDSLGLITQAKDNLKIYNHQKELEDTNKKIKDLEKLLSSLK